VANDKLVDLHTSIFLNKADEDRREERRAHLDSFFDATMDTYVAALEAGFPEAEAREITHVQANFDFFNHGWTEMMEIPGDELEPHYRRYESLRRPRDHDRRPARRVPARGGHRRGHRDPRET